MAREINLVPDIKNEMIKALKLRNFIFFLCIVVVAASIGVSLFFFSIVSGQKAVVSGKTDTLNIMSSKLNSYSDLSDFLTIRDQLGNLASISDNKKLISRTFGVLSAIIPTGADTITISNMSINLEDASPTITIEAQANAGKEPYIDYRVLDSFIKSMQYMRYDYGRYVDRDGNDIPSYCIIENSDDGASLMDSTKGRYALWTITADGCAPANYEEGNTTEDEDTDADANNNNSNNDSNNSNDTNDSDSDGKVPVYSGYSVEEYGGEKVVRIWRAPQFTDWYKENSKESKIDLDGTISGIEHFESFCTTYTGNKKSDNTIDWIEKNESCLLVPDGEDGISVSESNNGRNASGELVLRFRATITLAPEVFSFNYKHLVSLGPSTRHNVTDSYVQVQHMFEKRAGDCSADDVDCAKANQDNTNQGGLNGGN